MNPHERRTLADRALAVHQAFVRAQATYEAAAARLLRQRDALDSAIAEWEDAKAEMTRANVAQEAMLGELALFLRSLEDTPSPSSAS